MSNLSPSIDKTEYAYKQILSKILELYEENNSKKKDFFTKQTLKHTAAKGLKVREKESIYDLNSRDLRKDHYNDKSFLYPKLVLKKFVFEIIFAILVCCLSLWILVDIFIAFPEKSSWFSRNFGTRGSWFLILGVPLSVFMFYDSIKSISKIRIQQTEPNATIYGLVNQINFNEENKELLGKLMKDDFPLWEIYNYKYYQKLPEAVKEKDILV